jgi:hypothetical protein
LLGNKIKNKIEGDEGEKREGASISDPEARMLWVCLCLSGVVVVFAQPELK